MPKREPKNLLLIEEFKKAKLAIDGEGYKSFEDDAIPFDGAGLIAVFKDNVAGKKPRKKVAPKKDLEELVREEHGYYQDEVMSSDDMIKKIKELSIQLKDREIIDLLEPPEVKAAVKKPRKKATPKPKLVEVVKPNKIYVDLVRSNLPNNYDFYNKFCIELPKLNNHLGRSFYLFTELHKQKFGEHQETINKNLPDPARPYTKLTNFSYYVWEKNNWRCLVNDEQNIIFEVESKLNAEECYAAWEEYYKALTTE